MIDRSSSIRPRARLISVLLGGTALIGLPASVSAQNLEDTFEPPYRLSPIIVNAVIDADNDEYSVVAQELWTGGKIATSLQDTPASVSVVTAAEVEARDAETLEEVLQYTPGVHTDYYGSDDRNDYFLVRGYQATTYRDGMTLGTMRGVRETPIAFERIEVIRGANSTLFGFSDPGGSVNFVTRMPRFDRFGEIFGSVGSFDRAELGFDFGDTLDARETLAWRFTGQVRDGELEYENSEDDETFMMGGLTWEPTSATSFSLVFDHLERDATPNSGGYPLDRQYDRGLFFGEPDFNYQNVDRDTLSAFLRHDFGGGFDLAANLRYSNLSDDYGYVYLSDFAGRAGTEVSRYFITTDSEAEELIGNVILQYDRSFAGFDSSTLAGVEFRDAATSNVSAYGLAPSIDISNPVYAGGPTDLTLYADDETDYSARSAFLQQNLSFADRFVVTAGVRHDWLDLESTSFGVDSAGDFSETSMRGALTWRATEVISAYASYVESVAPPTIGTEPERGDQYEAGVKYSPTGYNAIFSAALFELNRDNVTVAVVQDDGTIEREVVGETRVRGFELEAKAELTENLDLIAGYSRIDPIATRSTLRDGTDVSGNQLASVPEQTATIWANYTLPAGALGTQTFGVGARYVGEYYFNLENNNGQSDATWTLDAAYSIDFGETTSLSLNVSNLLDEQHVVGRGTADYYSPSRSFAATLRRTW
ncbi:TonB-dependent siderophore receptor [Pseudoroseicyclus aestuarii]|uniref:Iron complex outermembrane receptor protein n=1 Tax=Pseudoroseicyclus aestuarii TaxID=1795041 RepID=A0A318SMM3_9RHOB|nr:TonB-dependent siderophore receptor [Pseudoroseicyclus aestuarii]PYE81321.1 iron complex outermembrane receptor protein [Pseudoroseicyclus aestuarii]